MNSPAIVAQSTAASTPKFEVISIKPCDGASAKGGGMGDRGRAWAPGRLTANCLTVSDLINWAYVSWDGHAFRPKPTLPVDGGPDWVTSEHFQIDARAERPTGRGIMMGPMMQALLADRFRLKIHRATREASVYQLTLGKSALKLEASKPDSCLPFDFDNPPPRPAPGQSFRSLCGNARPTENGMELTGATLADLCLLLSERLDRPAIDKTGITGKFDFHLALPRPEPTPPDTAAEPDNSPVFQAVQKLGLKLTPAKGPVEQLVIDRIAKPSPN